MGKITCKDCPVRLYPACGENIPCCQCKQEECNGRRYHSDPEYRAAVIERAKIWNREHKRKKTMKLEDQKLLMKDLCGRLPYGVKAQVLGWDEEKGEVEVPLKVYSINSDGYVYFEINDYDVDYLPIEDLLLFLKPMSSMTKEERKDFIECAGYEVEESENGRHYDYYLKDFCGTEDAPCANADAIDWLNAHHFDYRGLIEKGLALEAPKDMYK